MIILIDSEFSWWIFFSILLMFHFIAYLIAKFIARSLSSPLQIKNIIPLDAFKVFSLSFVFSGTWYAYVKIFWKLLCVVFSYSLGFLDFWFDISLILENSLQWLYQIFLLLFSFWYPHYTFLIGPIILGCCALFFSLCISVRDISLDMS